MSASELSQNQTVPTDTTSKASSAGVENKETHSNSNSKGKKRDETTSSHGVKKSETPEKDKRSQEPGQDSKRRGLARVKGDKAKVSEDKTPSNGKADQDMQEAGSEDIFDITPIVD